MMVADPERPQPEYWRELVAEREHALEGFTGVGGRLFLSYLEDAVPTVRIFSLEGEELDVIEPPGLASVSLPVGRWQDEAGYYGVASFHIPPTTYRYVVATGETTVWHRPAIAFDSEALVTERAFVTSKDGTRVPLFLCHRRGLELTGENCTLLTGYGGFNAAMRPGFSVRNAAWLERGGVLAVACTRGGGEYGREWHEAGMKEHKQNVFDDFIAASEYLIEAKYTSPRRLAISGGSNGGLLVGAALTQRPELYRAVECTVPLLDMVRYHKFLLGSLWVPEYGSADDPEQFPYLLAYSPYHHVQKGTKYPAILFVTGDSDTRVAPLHARKMCALLQAASASGLPVLLHYETEVGHSGGRPATKAIEDMAIGLSFLAWQVGLELE